MEGAILDNARLDGVNLEPVKHLTQVQLDKACVTDSTKLPKGLKRPKPCPPEGRPLFGG